MLAAILTLLLIPPLPPSAAGIDTIIAGNDGHCVPFEPTLSRVLERLSSDGSSFDSGTNVAVVAQAPGGRVFAAVDFGSGFNVAELLPSGSLTTLTLPIADGDPFAMTVDAAGTIYVLAGHAHTPDHFLVAFNADGTVHATWPLGAEYATFPSLDHRAESSIDLAADQCTLFLIRNGTLIRRFDVCSGSFLADFAALPERAHALRVLPGGGLLVAQEHSLVEYSLGGSVVRTFPLPGLVYAMTLRDGGTRAAYGVIACGGGDLVVRDLAGGAIVRTTQLQTEAPASIVAYTGWTAAIGPAHLTEVPATSPMTLAVIGALILALAVVKLR